MREGRFAPPDPSGAKARTLIVCELVTTRCDLASRGHGSGHISGAAAAGRVRLDGVRSVGAFDVPSAETQRR